MKKGLLFGLFLAAVIYGTAKSGEPWPPLDIDTLVIVDAWGDTCEIEIVDWWTVEPVLQARATYRLRNGIANCFADRIMRNGFDSEISTHWDRWVSDR